MKNWVQFNGFSKQFNILIQISFVNDLLIKNFIIIIIIWMNFEWILILKSEISEDINRIS